MCEYSLAYFPNRLAVEGERLLLRRFPCGTLGMVSARRSFKSWLFPSTCAVCIPPGARLGLEGIPQDLQRRLAIGAAEEVTFTQQSAEVFTYRDAVRFSGGREVLLQSLPVGLRVRVLSVLLAEAEEPRRHSMGIAGNSGAATALSVRGSISNLRS
jgi:hypothetical protein